RRIDRSTPISRGGQRNDGGTNPLAPHTRARDRGASVNWIVVVVSIRRPSWRRGVTEYRAAPLGCHAAPVDLAMTLPTMLPHGRPELLAWGRGVHEGQVSRTALA